METTNIRAHGNREYWDKVAVFARSHRTSTAAIVKAAVDKAIGDSLNSIELSSLPSDIAEQQISNVGKLEPENV